MRDEQPILLNPGPVKLTERVRAALTKVDLCHREPEFADLMLEIKSRLRAVYREAAHDYEAVLLSGSGTLAVEAMFQSLLPRRGKLLTLANGAYGERIHDLVTISGKASKLVRADWPEPMDLKSAERILAEDPAVTHVAAVHNETTTGRLNDLDSLGALCRRYDKPLLLDAVSSFGGERVEFERWNLAALAATANKCLHAAPGLSFVLARRDCLEPGEGEKSPAGAIYLDLFRYYEAQKSGFSPYTMTTHAAVAFREALEELEREGGYEARMARYREVSGRIRQGLGALGVECFLESHCYSSMISSFYLPEGYDYDRLHDVLRREGFVIYAGQGGLAHRIFRIANMGWLTDADVERLIEVFRRGI